MELLNGTPVFLWRAVCVFAVAALFLSGWALLVQRRVRRLMARK